MPSHTAGPAGLRRPAPLTFKIPEVAKLPTIKPQPCGSRRRGRPSAATIVEAIAADAARAAKKLSTVVVAVPAAANGDPTLLFLRANGETQFMIGVPPEIIRSPRLRGDDHRRDHDTERQWEYLRVAEAQAHYEADAGVDDADDLGDDGDADMVSARWSL